MISQVKRTWRAHYGLWPIKDCLCATWHARAPRDTPHLSIIHRHLAQSIYSCVIPRSRSGLHLERQLVSLVAFYQIESASRILSQIDVFELRVYVFCISQCRMQVNCISMSTHCKVPTLRLDRHFKEPVVNRKIYTPAWDLLAWRRVEINLRGSVQRRHAPLERGEWEVPAAFYLIKNIYCGRSYGWLKVSTHV